MYPFERFLNHLKSKTKNKRYVEGSIADAYMLEESTHFASIYFNDDVQSRRTRIGRNLNDGGIDPNLPITLSIFNRPGQSMGKRKTRYLSAEEYFAAHQLYENGLRRYNPGCTDQDVDDEIERNFAHWFKEYVHSPMNNVCNQSLIDLACGPIMEVSTYMGYVVNGFKFQTEAYCYRKSTSNDYGVSIKGSGLAQLESNFFGTLQEVVEVEYPNVPIKKVVLFKCEWFDPTPNVGSRFNSEYGIAEVYCKISFFTPSILQSFTHFSTFWTTHSPFSASLDAPDILEEADSLDILEEDDSPYWYCMCWKGLAGDLNKAMKDGKPIIIEGGGSKSDTVVDKNEIQNHSNCSAEIDSSGNDKDCDSENVSSGKEVFADELNKATNALESLLNETKDKAVKYSTADEKPALKRAKSGAC
nr:uncharacterized protein LOC109190933 [Ipomoea batatas]